MFFNPTNCLILSALLFSIGMYGVLARRNILIILIAIELMLNAVNLSIMTFARMIGDGGSSFYANDSGNIAHVFVLFNMAVAAAEAAVGLAILIALFKHKRTMDTSSITVMKG